MNGAKAFSSARHMNVCPVCEGPAIAWCRCPCSNRWCEKEHQWRPCSVHRDEKVIVPEGDSHDFPGECTCRRKEEEEIEDDESASEDQPVATMTNVLKRLRTLEERLATLEEERVTKRQKKERK
jgi:hypothetical protein